MSMTPQQAEQLGGLIGAYRAKKGMSLQQLANEVGLQKSWIGAVELGQYVDPDPSRLARLASSLEIEPQLVDQLAGGAIRMSLPEPRLYFRSKLDLTAEEAAQVERYIVRLRRRP